MSTASSRSEPHTELTLIANGEPAGSLTALTSGEGTFEVRFEVDNNGRGAKLIERIDIDSGGLPTRWRIQGTSLMGGAVDEHFERDAGGHSSFTSQADEGATERMGFYLPADSSPFAIALLAAAPRSDDGAVPLLPSGTATIAPVSVADGILVELEVLRISGVGLGDEYVLRSRSGKLLGIWDGSSALLTDELVPSAGEISAALLALSTDRLAAVSQASTLHSGGTLVIRNARVLDVLTGELSEPRTLVITGRMLTAILEPDVQEPAADTVIDADGRIAMPGLHDMHAHLQGHSALLYVAAGVTGVRDMGNDNAALPALIASITNGDLLGPSVAPAGFIEGRSPYSALFGRVVDSLDEALDAVDWYADHGYPSIKLYNSFDPDWVAPTASRAHERGMTVMGHIPAFMNADRAIADGYDEITHLNQLALGWVLEPDEDTRTPLRLTGLARVADLDVDDPRVVATIRTMADRGIGLDTTLVIIEQLMLSRARTVTAAHRPVIDHMPARWSRARKRTYVPFGSRDELDAYARSFARLVEITRRLHDSGVALWPGTDDATGISVHRELELYVQAGIPASDVLRIATLDCEMHLQRGHERGLVAVGCVADLVLLDADPREDISAVRRVALTVAEGRAISPARIHRAFGIVPWAAEPAIGLATRMR
jgi:hypothetical protein